MRDQITCAMKEMREVQKKEDEEELVKMKREAIERIEKMEVVQHIKKFTGDFESMMKIDYEQVSLMPRKVNQIVLGLFDIKNSKKLKTIHLKKAIAHP